MRTTVVGLVILGAVGLAACGGDGDGSGATETAATAASDVVVDTADSELGTILVDGEGMTLYLFDSDPEGGTACTDGCAETWPPVMGAASAAGDADAGLLGTIERPDGSAQATYGGHPLYLYAPDQAPGDVTGQGVGEVWWVVGPDGAAIRDTAAPATTPAGAATSPAGVPTPAY